MTRHTLLKEKSGGETKEIVVGWDNPFNTYFLHVLVSDGKTDVVLEDIGRKPNEHQFLKTFVDVCKNNGYELNPDIVETLRNDKNTALPLTVLQKNMLNMFASLKGE